MNPVVVRVDNRLRLAGCLLAAGDWPAEWAAHVPDFAASAEVERFCAQSEAEWQSSTADLATVLAHSNLAAFLADWFGQLDVSLSVFPNLLYPGRQAVPAGEVVLSQPPPAAWGASPPWRYGERPDRCSSERWRKVSRLSTRLRECSHWQPPCCSCARPRAQRRQTSSC